MDFEVGLAVGKTPAPDSSQCPAGLTPCHTPGSLAVPSGEKVKVQTEPASCTPQGFLPSSGCCYPYLKHRPASLPLSLTSAHPGCLYSLQPLCWLLSDVPDAPPYVRQVTGFCYIFLCETARLCLPSPVT